jgi:hypothetical protein
LPDGGQLFNVEIFDGGVWVVLNEEPILIENGQSSISLDAIIYEETTVRVRSVDETITSNTADAEVCEPSILLGASYLCGSNVVRFNVQTFGFGENFTAAFQVYNEGTETWDEIVSGVAYDAPNDAHTQDTVYPLANGTYQFRVITQDQLVISNIDSVDINCELPQIEIVSADYDCLTDDINVEFTLASPHTTEDIVFKFGLGDPTPWLHTWNELDHATGGGNSTYTAGPIANGTYVVVAVITDVNGTHTSEPFEVIVNCA